MTRNMRHVIPKRGEIIHVETPNGIVNIYTGLQDREGRSVDRIEVIPDNYAGENKVVRRGDRLVRLKTVKA
jgi:hypothetical protein